MTTRRSFLGAAAGAGLGPLALARDWVRSQPARAQPGDYALGHGVHYLNHASIGTMPRVLQAARARYLATCEENPWLYMWGGAWDTAREQARAAVAALVGCDPDELAITHNTTEGFNLLASGLRLGAGDEVLFSSLNHPGASLCFTHWGARRGYAVRRFELPAARAAAMTDEQLVAAHAEQVRPATRLVVLPHIDNTIGRRHPVRALAAAVRSAGARWVAVDGAQAVGMIPVQLDELGADAYATSPHKWLEAPKGLGALHVRAALREDLLPMWVTWGQQRFAGTGRVYEDYGTRNLPEVMTLGDAAERMQRLGGAVEDRLRVLHARCAAAVAERAGLRWRSPERWALGASLFAIEVMGQDSREVGELLWQEHGFVTRAFAQPDLNALRVSPGMATADATVERFFAVMDQHVLG